MKKSKIPLFSLVLKKTQLFYPKRIKKSIILSILLVFQSFSYVATAQDAVITLSTNPISILQLLKDIEKQTNYLVIYSRTEVDTSAKFSAERRSDKVSTFLSKAFDGKDINYELENNYIILSKRATKEEKSEGSTSSRFSSSQQTGKTVRGTVVDEKGEPIIGASVVVRGNINKGTLTDVNGEYTLTNIPENTTLDISFVGMKEQSFQFKGQSTINITMEENTEILDEVVVVGYGTRMKKDITTSISSIDAQEISKQVPSSPELLMQGRMSGVQVIGNQGNPNARPTVRIRGTNTWGISDPLFVVDGIPIKEYGAGIEGINDQYIRGEMNIMNMIDPNDIESISVLKDASAAAIYGVRAANGVILITTKTGRKEHTRINFSSRFGSMNVSKKLDVLNTQEFAEFNNLIFASDPSSGSSRSPFDNVFDVGTPNYLGNSPTYDWQDAVINKEALTQDYSLSISGGSEKTDYFASLGYSDQDGIYIGKNMKRYSGSIKINSQVSDYIKFGVNYRISYGTGINRTWNNSLISISMTPPWQPIYDENGINGYAPAIAGYSNNPDTWEGSVLYGSGTRYNVPGYFSMQYGNNSSLRNMGNTYIEIMPIKDLTFRTSLGIDLFDNKVYGGEQYISSYFKYDGTPPDTKGGPGSVGDYQRRVISNFNIISETSLNYLKTFGLHHINLLANATLQYFAVDFVEASTDYVTSTNIDLIGLGGDRQYTQLSSSKNRSALQGYLLRASYNYDSKYYLDLVLRRDGSSRFAPEKRWGTFPAISAAWRITKENFMKNVNWLDDLKLRAGWGELGNQEVREMAFLSPINTAPTYAWGNNPTKVGYGYVSTGAAVYGMANRDLTWERTATLNIGFDAVAFKNFDFSAEYYNKVTDGILQTVTLPKSVGAIEVPVDNVAKVQNSGFEFSLNYRGNIRDFNFAIGGNLTTVKNQVVGLYGGIPMYSIEEGYPINYIRGYKVGGIFQSMEEVQNFMNTYYDVSHQRPKVNAGDLYFLDLRGAPTASDIEKGINKYFSPEPDDIIDHYDQVYLGKRIPGYYYGINLSADYKGFDLTMQFTGVGDVQKVNETRQTLGGLSTVGFNRLKEVLNHWTPNNTNTNIPRAVWGDPAGSFRFSDYFVSDADYLRLANLQLGYSLPSSFYRALKNGIKNMRLYVGGSNLLTFTKFDGLDPEDEHNPAPKIFYMGLNIQF